ncbi:hypothetical protein COP2_044818 [Malus domestica]
MEEASEGENQNKNHDPNPQSKARTAAVPSSILHRPTGIRFRPDQYLHISYSYGPPPFQRPLSNPLPPLRPGYLRHRNLCSRPPQPKLLCHLLRLQLRLILLRQKRNFDPSPKLGRTHFLCLLVLSDQRFDIDPSKSSMSSSPSSFSQFSSTRTGFNGKIAPRESKGIYNLTIPVRGRASPSAG